MPQCSEPSHSEKKNIARAITADRQKKSSPHPPPVRESTITSAPRPEHVVHTTPVGVRSYFDAPLLDSHDCHGPGPARSLSVTRAGRGRTPNATAKRSTV